MSIWLGELGEHDNDFGVNDTIEHISTNLYFCTSGMGVGINVLHDAIINDLVCNKVETMNDDESGCKT